MEASIQQLSLTKYPESEWGPAKQIKPDDEMTSQTRNTLNTVRRIGVRKVGQEGRLSAEENIQKEEAGN